MAPAMDANLRSHGDGSLVRRSYLVIFLIALGQARSAGKKYYREYYPSQCSNEP